MDFPLAYDFFRFLRRPQVEDILKRPETEVDAILDHAARKEWHWCGRCLSIPAYVPMDNEVKFSIERELLMQPPVINEQALLETLRSSNQELRDPRELVTLLQRARKPLLLIDELRVDQDKSHSNLVMWSCVALDSINVWDLNVRLNEALTREPRLRKKNEKYLSQDATATTYCKIIDEALRTARILRAGITYNSMRRWKESKKNPYILKGEFGSILSMIGVIAEQLKIEGLVVAVVDAAMQNGLDPNQLQLAPDTIGAKLYDGDPPRLIIASSPESPFFGALLSLPDLDAARARKDPAYEKFIHSVRNALDEQILYWPQ